MDANSGSGPVSVPHKTPEAMTDIQTDTHTLLYVYPTGDSVQTGDITTGVSPRLVGVYSNKCPC